MSVAADMFPVREVRRVGDEEESAVETVRIRMPNGEVEELPVRYHRSDDPEINALWSMSIGQLEAIVEKESHPLHAKALLVQEEASRPLREAIGGAFGNLNSLSGIEANLGVPLKIGNLFDVPKLTSTDWSGYEVVRPRSMDASKESIAPVVPLTVADAGAVFDSAAHQIQQRQADSLAELVEHARAEKEARAADEPRKRVDRRMAWLVLVGAWVAVIVSILAWLFPHH